MNNDDAMEALVELAASRHNAFHTSEAADIGIDRTQLTRAELRGALRRLHPQVWSATGLPSTPRQVLRGAVLSVPAAAATGMSSAWLHGWLDNPPSRPQLWVSRPSRRHPVADLRRAVRVDPHVDLTVVDRVPTLGPAATLCLLGSTVAPDLLERFLDRYLRTGSADALVATMNRLRGSRSSSITALGRLIDPSFVGERRLAA